MGSELNNTLTLTMYSICFHQNEREAERSRVERDQDRIAKALEAARGVGDKEEEIKELALQVDALKVHLSEYVLQSGVYYSNNITVARPRRYISLPGSRIKNKFFLCKS